jgi:PAS domain S-box-containing protein
LRRKQMKTFLRWFSQILSFVILLISSGALAAYILDYPALNLSLLFPEAIAMRFNTAFCFVLVAITGLLYERRLYRFIQLASLSAVAMICSVTLLNQLFDWNAQFDFNIPAQFLSIKYQHLIRSSVYSSSLLLVLAMGYILLVTKLLSRIYLATTAVLILSLAFIMMIAVFLQFPLGQNRPLNEYVALITTFQFGLASINLLIHSLRDFRANRKSTYVFIPIWVAMLALSLGFGLFMTWASYYDFNARVQADHKLRTASEAIQSDIDAVEKSIQRMADRWMFDKGLSEAAWRADARRSIQDMKFLKYIIKLDENDSPKWWVYLDEEEGRRTPPASYFLRLKGELAHSLEQNRTFYDLGASLFSGEQELIIFFPLKLKGKKDGFFVAVLDEKEVIDELILKSGISLLRVRAGDRDLAGNAGHEDRGKLRKINSEIVVGDFSYYATGYYPITTLGSGHVLVVLIVSLGIAGLFLGLLYLKFNADRLRMAAEFNEKIARITLEDSVMGVLRVKSSGIITYSNAAADKILGYGDSELLGQHLNILIPPELRDVHGDHFNRYLEAPYSRKMFVLDKEIEAYRKDGAFVPIEVSLSYLKVGEENEMLAFVYDLTDKAERNRFFDMSLDLIAVMTTDDCLKEVNAAWAGRLGWTVEELVNRKFLSLVHPDDHILIREALNEARTRKASLKLECRMISSTGAVRWFWWTGSVFQRKLYLNGRDISDQKNKARMLERLNESYEIINSVSNVGIWDWDVAQNTVSWSPRFYQLLGYRDREFPSYIERFMELVHIDDRDDLTTRIQNRFEGQPKIDNEVRLLVKAGTYRWFRVMGVVISNSNNQVTRIMGSIQDIHPIKQAEQNAERKLSRYLGELQRSNRELEQFAYIASHDLQTPLRHIMSFTNLLTKKLKLDDDAESAQWLVYINQGVKQMEQLILDLLAYSRIRKNEFKRESVDLNQVIQDIRDVNHDLESKASVEVSKLPVVSGYSMHLRQLFQNLVGNAAKFGRHDVAVQIKIYSEENPNEWIIAVEDNGIGINEDQFERIFQLFQRLHPKGKYEGTGIGLAICKKSAELHGGRIWLESTVGSGTTFFVSLNKQQEQEPTYD